MNIAIRILLFAVLFTCVSMQEKICHHLGFGPNIHMEDATGESPKEDSDPNTASTPSNYFLSDSIYRWDETIFEWINTGQTLASRSTEEDIARENSLTNEPIEINWKVLLDIEYRLRYFSELGMEVYAPVFSKALEHLDGKEVIIEGFVIPFYEEEEIVSLSQNPFASCFFCGKASPASIISLYLKKKGKRYKMDDFKKFQGRLHLNYDDPNEFYYILKNAKEVR